MPTLTLAERLAIPLDSSPIQGPSPSSDPAGPLFPPQSPLPPLDLSSGRAFAASPSPLERHKRPARDMSQFAEETSRVLKLAKTEHDGLLLDRAEQLVSVAGHLFKLSRTISTIQPADALWTVPSFLKKRIEDNVAILMMDSSIPAYRSEDIGTPKLLLDLLVANDTAWGYTEEIRTDPYKVEVLDACMSRAMVTARNGFKNTLKKSCGSPPAEGQTLRTGALNIVALTEALLKQFKHVKTGRVVIDVALCGRIAVLRQLVLEKNDNSYWTDVDSYLASLRTSYPDKVQYSRFVKRKILDVDFDLYGRVSIDGYPSTRRAEPATPVQSSSSAAGTPPVIQIF